MKFGEPFKRLLTISAFLLETNIMEHPFSLFPTYFSTPSISFLAHNIQDLLGVSEIPDGLILYGNVLQN